MRLRFAAATIAATALIAAPFALAQDSKTAPKTATQKGIFWKITSDAGGELYVLGSIHAATEEFYPLPKEIEDAYRKSKTLAVEADAAAEDPAALQTLVMEKGMYGEGDSLKKHVSKDTITKLKAVCEKEGVPYTQLKTMKPWMIAIQLQAVAMQKLSMRMDLGIDKHFLDDAHANKKTIVQLESAKEQLDMISGFPDDLEEKFLLSTLEDNDKMKETLETIMTGWLEGNDGKIDELTAKGEKEHPEFAPVMKALLFDRNVKMAKHCEEFLDKKEPAFVVVGSAHVVGDRGVVKLLEATKKYKIERPDVTPAPKSEAKKDDKKPEKKGDDKKKKDDDDD